MVLAFLALAVALADMHIPLQKEEMAVCVDLEENYNSSINVIVQGEDVLRPGKYTVPYDSTYEDIFLLAGVLEPPLDLDPKAPLDFCDAVFFGDILYIYLVV